MDAPRRVNVFAGARADLGPLEPVIVQLAGDPRFDVTVLLSRGLGDVAHDELASVAKRLEVGRGVAQTTASSLGALDASLTEELATHFQDDAPDMVILL